MKINRLFSIAAATMMMVACSSEDTALKNTPAAGPQMQFTATIAAPSSGTTRTEYTESGTDINVAWKVGDEIALVHGSVRDVATVKTINADGSATINGYVTGATNNENVTLYYPAALVKSVTNDGPVFDDDLWGRISTQDGTLKYIQDNLDFRSAKGQLSVNETSATLKEAAKMYAMIAIWKLKLKDNASALLEASKVSIKMGSGDYTTSATATLSSPKSELTIATNIPPAIDNVRPITIEATVGNNTYVYKQDNVDVTPGTYYQSTVTMTKVIDLSKLTADYEAKDGDVLTGTLGANVKISIAAGATVTLDGVTINGANSGDFKWAGITCEGAATIILKEGKTNTVTGFHTNYPGIQAGPTGTTLTIKGETAGTGKLTASSNGNGAGIGGKMSMDCGNIEIQGGVITATGSSYAAGIGGANSSTCGSITISGGTVTATGGDKGAGIGSGGGTCGNITISGGTVTANGGNEGAGIGSGGGGTCGDILISGGTIEATGGTDAAGIGSGTGTEGCGAITISGGTVTATGGENAAGIGSGYEGKCTTITISGGTVTATGGNGNGGAGIGTGNDGSCGDITITTGVTQVTAKKGGGADNSIGKATNPGNGSCGTVTIGGVNTGAISTSPYVYPVTAITVTWNYNDITGSGKSFTKDGVTITCGKNIDFNAKNFRNGGTFTTTLGNFTKIEVTADGFDEFSGTGWSGNSTKKTWTGTPASSVSFSGTIMGNAMGNTKFVFTIEP